MDLETNEEERLIKPTPVAAPSTNQRMREEEHNPFNTTKTSPRNKEREALLAKMNKSSGGKHRSCCSRA